MRTKFKALAAMAAVATLALAGCSSSGSDSGGDASGGSDEPFKVIAFTSGNQTPIGAWWVKAVEATYADTSRLAQATGHGFVRNVRATYAQDPRPSRLPEKLDVKSGPAPDMAQTGPS